MAQTETFFAPQGISAADLRTGRGLAGQGRAWLKRLALVPVLTAYAGLLALGWWATTHLAPDHVSVRLAGHTLTLKDIHHRIISNAMLMFGLLPLALWAEYASVGWERSSIRSVLGERTATVKTDLAVFFLGQAHVMDVLGRLMMLVASMISGGWIHDWLSRALGVSLGAGFLPVALQVVLYFFVYSFFDYWTHRVDHSPWFWPLHRYHHSAEEFCVLTSGRQHPVSFSSILLINVPLAVLGAPPQVMIYVNVMVVSLGFLIHSRIDSNWGWIGRYVIQSPNHHRLHHKLDMSRPTGHYSMTPVWDHLFGTWRGEADQTLAIGVDTPYRHGFWIAPDLLRDYWDFWMSLAGRRRGAW